MGLSINKLVCQHCSEENPNYFKFGSMDIINPQSRMLNNFIGQNYEFIPKVSVGFYFECAKCGKHTIIIPNNYDHREMNMTIPQQIIFSPTFQQPEFSAIIYVITGEGLLDQIVKTNDNKTISLLTKQEMMNDGKWKIIDKDIYNICLNQGFKEVSNVQRTNDVNINEIYPSTTTKPIHTEMANDVSTGTTTMASTSTTNATTTKR